MANIPREPKVDQIVWFENHIDAWKATPTAFGITAALATALDVQIKVARGAYDAALAARQAAKNATIAQDQEVREMLTAGREMVNTMKAFIEQSGNTALWSQAGLEPPAPPGTAPSPTAPYQISASLDSEGNIILKWKTSQPAGLSGVIYSIRRSVDGGPFTLLDSVGEKTFTDDGVTSDMISLSYTIQAKRGRQLSPLSESLTVRLGRAAGGGGFAITGMSTGPAKMVA